MFGKMLLLMLTAPVQAVYSPEKETEIRQETVLHASYDAISRPEEQTHVFLSMTILAIDELDIKGQKLTAAGWLTFEWKDSRLTWDKTAKDDIEYIFAKPKDIWKPEVVIDNSLADLGVIHDDELLLRIKYDGTVDWEPMILFETHCNVDITFYPYDKQKCAIEVVSWGYNFNEIMLEHITNEVNLEDYVENGEWQMIKTYVEDKNLTEHTSHGVVVYPQLDYWFYLTRRTDYYNLNILMPIFLTSMLICLVFNVPVASGEKLTYVLTVQLSLAVLLTVINDAMPSTSVTTSILGIYLGIVLILAAVAVLLTVLIIMVYHRDGIPSKKDFSVIFTRASAKIMRSPIGKKKRPDTMTKIVQLNKEGSEVKDDNGDIMVTWQEIATTINRMFFIVFLSVTVVMNAAFFISLQFGGGSY